MGEEGLADSIKAWEYIKKKDVITKRTILHIHKLVMRNLWPEIAGKFRKCNVTVGGRRCPDWREIETGPLGIDYVIDCLNTTYDDMARIAAVNRSPCPSSEDICKNAHIEFEKLHPHMDCNGRTGRILYNWQRKKHGLDVHVIKADERFKYYEWFQK